MKLGVLVGRPIGRETSYTKLDSVKEKVIEQFRWGVPLRRLAKNFNVDRNTIARTLVHWGCYDEDPSGELRRTKLQIDRERQRERQRISYKEEGWKNVSVDRDKMMAAILADKTIPEIADIFPEYTYEQIYDTILMDVEFNTEYRKHGQLKIRRPKK